MPSVKSPQSSQSPPRIGVKQAFTDLKTPWKSGPTTTKQFIGAATTAASASLKSLDAAWRHAAERAPALVETALEAMLDHLFGSDPQKAEGRSTSSPGSPGSPGPSSALGSDIDADAERAADTSFERRLFARRHPGHAVVVVVGHR